MNDGEDPFSYDPSICRKVLIDYLRMLSGPPDTQVDWLKGHDLPAQEPWFEYDDYMTGAVAAASQGVITPAEWQALRNGFRSRSVRWY
jgi:hypothetical protein